MYLFTHAALRVLAIPLTSNIFQAVLSKVLQVRKSSYNFYWNLLNSFREHENDYLKEQRAIN